MRILYLFNSFPRISMKFVLDEMISVRDHGHEVFVIAKRKSDEVVCHQNPEGIPIYFMEEGIEAFVRSKSIDHIHVHFANNCVGLAYRIHQLLGVPFSFTTHAFDLYLSPHVGLPIWCNAAKMVFTISQFNKEYMSKTFGVDPSRIKVVRCGVFPEKLEPTAYSRDQFKIISVCRLIKKKGMSDLINACHELSKRGIDFICEIVGEGTEKDNIQMLIRDYGLSEKVRLRGGIPHPGLVDFMRSGSVFVLPCVQGPDRDMDGIPVVLMEAMALRIPVISTTVSGVPELIENGENGLLVSPGNVGELVDAILEIKNNQALVEKIRSASRERIQQSYSSRSNAKKFITAIELPPLLSDFDLPAVRFCQENQSDGGQAGAVLADFKVMGANLFNPSFYEDENLMVTSFRAIPNGDDRLTSYVSVRDGEKSVLKNISREYSQALNCLELQDPKVFALGSMVYVTFHSGHVKGGNDIFVMSVSPFDSPRRIVYKGRKEQERNWAFFRRGGGVYAVYWLNPLKVLRLKSESSTVWEFEDFFEVPGVFGDDTIGTQLCEVDGRYYFMSHRKYTVRGKKLYLGRIGCFDFEEKKVTFGDDWYAYSTESLAGDHVKHNNNLFSCTYFSGMQIIDGEVVLGYGINDVDYGFSRHRLSDFFVTQESR